MGDAPEMGGVPIKECPMVPQGKIWGFDPRTFHVELPKYTGNLVDIKGDKLSKT